MDGFTGITPEPERPDITVALGGRFKLDTALILADILNCHKMWFKTFITIVAIVFLVALSNATPEYNEYVADKLVLAETSKTELSTTVWVVSDGASYFIKILVVVTLLFAWIYELQLLYLWARYKIVGPETT